MMFNTQAEWDLIETMLPDMLRVALSIKAGTIMPSTILCRLATYSRKNKLYFAFRELGRVMRTIFLVQYVSDLELRQGDPGHYQQKRGKLTNYSPAHHALHLGHSDDGLDDATRLAICDCFVEEIEIVKLN
jgi:Tn3 transposase DDE domain